jgi:hypothetical protein
LSKNKAALLKHHNSENAQDKIVSFSNQLDAIRSNLFEGKKGRYLHAFQSDVPMIYDTERRVLLEEEGLNTSLHPANVFKETKFSSYPMYLDEISDNKLKDGLKGGFQKGVEFHLFDIENKEIKINASVIGEEKDDVKELIDSYKKTRPLKRREGNSKEEV